MADYVLVIPNNKLKTVFFCKIILVTSTHFHKVTHVNFLEGCQHGSGVLGLFETGCDTLTDIVCFGEMLYEVST